MDMVRLAALQSIRSLGKSYGSGLWKLNPRGYTSGKPRGLGRCRSGGLRGRPTPRVPGGTACSWGRSAPARSPATVSPSHVYAAEVTGATGTPPPSEAATGVVGDASWPWWRSLGRTVAWGGNDLVGEFREHALAPHRLQLLELSVGRTNGSDLLRRCRLSQASCDEEGKKDRLLELKGLHYSDVEVGYDLPLLVVGWMQGDLLEVDEKVPGP